MFNRSVENDGLRNDCRIIDMKREYPGYCENIRWMIISELSPEELSLRYGEAIERFSPFICIDRSLYEPIRKSHSNDDKFRIRTKKLQEIYAYEDDIFESFHPELIHDPFSEPDWSHLYDAIELLSDIQKRRIEKRYFKDMQVTEIAKEEGSTKQAVCASIQLALSTMREYLLQAK
jgi:hypothetical protein